MTTHQHNGHRLNVIAVEDDIISAAALKQILESSGCHVDTYLSGEEFLANISSKYDLIILDYELPDTNGFLLIDAIRGRNDDIATIPIVFLTSHQEKEITSLARKTGINGFITKPLSSAKCNFLLAEFKSRH